MQAKVTVAAGEAMLAVVTIDDTNPLDMKFVPVNAKVVEKASGRRSAG